MPWVLFPLPPAVSLDDGFDGVDVVLSVTLLALTTRRRDTPAGAGG